jgi:hypothetical protein
MLYSFSASLVVHEGAAGGAGGVATGGVAGVGAGWAAFAEVPIGDSFNVRGQK